MCCSHCNSKCHFLPKSQLRSFHSAGFGKQFLVPLLVCKQLELLVVQDCDEFHDGNFSARGELRLAHTHIRVRAYERRVSDLAQLRPCVLRNGRHCSRERMFGQNTMLPTGKATSKQSWIWKDSKKVDTGRTFSTIRKFGTSVTRNPGAQRTT